MRGLLLMVVVAGCAETPTYFYAPESAKVTRGNLLASETKIPPEQPRGSVEVASAGITEMTPKPGQPIRTLHVRMFVDNDDDPAAWTIDTRRQMVDLEGVGESAPMFARSDRQTLPTVTVGRRERRTLDLYFPLPTGVSDPGDLPAFDFLWQVDTPARPITGRTHIQRHELVEPTTYSDLWDPGWGPYWWWYDPLYPHVYYVPLHGHYWH
jgi:hypothetical protein